LADFSARTQAALIRSRIVSSLVFPMVVAVLGCRSAEPGMSRVSRDDVGESSSMRYEESLPTPRMIALAHILAGSWVENEWFETSDIERTQGVRIFPAGVQTAHDAHFDKIANPETCAVERSFLMYSGRVQRTELIEVDCEIFWREVAYVDRFFESRGFLPASSLDLASFLESSNSEWGGAR